MAISEDVANKLYDRIDRLERLTRTQKHALESTLLALQCVYTSKHFKEELFCADIRKSVLTCIKSVREAIKNTETHGILPD